MSSRSERAVKFGPYTILDRIGDGGMAEIYLAKMEGNYGFEKLLALKKILPRYSQNAAFAKMLIHEAKLAARLQHFNVVQVLDLGEIGGQVFIAMEYVRGRDLAALLSHAYRRKEKLPVALSLCIGTEFLTGLDYAHRIQGEDGRPLGLIHRDISPQNILISYEGEVKVTDFGIARVLVEKDQAQLPSNLHGKFGYMSPEQVVGKPLDQRSDIFSAGVVLHEMLTGQRLFRGKTPRATIEMILSTTVDPPSKLNPEVPPEIDEICTKALAKDRSERYQTVGSLLGDLSRVSDRLPQRAQRRDLSVYMRRQFGPLISARKDNDRKSWAPPPAEVSGFSAPSGGRTPIGELLVQHGALTLEELELGLAEQRARGRRIGEILVETGVVQEADLVHCLAKQAGLATLSDDDLRARQADPAIMARYPRDAVEATMCVPLSIDGDRVTMAITDPYDNRALLESKVVLGISETTNYLVGRAAMREMITRWYGARDVDVTISSDSMPAAPAPLVPARAPGAAIVVLIADADAGTADALAERVRGEDYEVITVNDGKAAREVCREKNPVVAFLDANLPGIDGYNILLDLRSRDADAAVFITSARSDDFHQSKALELGADDFIPKPFNLEVTNSKIRREVQKRSKGRRAMAPPTQFGGVSGSLTDMTLLDIIQGLELGRKSAQVVVQYEDGREGEVSIVEGDLKGCSSGSERGEQAFYVVAKPGPGLFRIEYRGALEPPNITRPNTFLILEAMRRLDEEGRVVSEQESEVMGSGSLDVTIDSIPPPPSEPPPPPKPPVTADSPAFRPTMPLDSFTALEDADDQAFQSGDLPVIDEATISSGVTPTIDAAALATALSESATRPQLPARSIAPTGPSAPATFSPPISPRPNPTFNPINARPNPPLPPVKPRPARTLDPATLAADLANDLQFVGMGAPPNPASPSMPVVPPAITPSPVSPPPRMTGQFSAPLGGRSTLQGNLPSPVPRPRGESGSGLPIPAPARNHTPLTAPAFPIPRPDSSEEPQPLARVTLQRVPTLRTAPPRPRPAAQRTLDDETTLLDEELEATLAELADRSKPPTK